MQLYIHLHMVWEMKYLSPLPRSLALVTERKLQKPSYINKGNIPIKSKALIYDGFGKILDVTTTGY